jgi:hypothetical protein
MTKLFVIHKLTHPTIQVAIRDDGVVFYRTGTPRGRYSWEAWSAFQADAVQLEFLDGDRLKITYPCGSVDIAKRAHYDIRLPKAYKLRQWDGSLEQAKMLTVKMVETETEAA